MIAAGFGTGQVLWSIFWFFLEHAIARMQAEEAAHQGYIRSVVQYEPAGA